MEKSKDFIEIRTFIMRDFCKFLKKRGIYLEFKENFVKDKTCRYAMYKRMSVVNNQARFFIDGPLLMGDTYQELAELINYSFTWSMTKEGHNYWLRLSNLWRKTMKTSLEQKYGNEIASKRGFNELRKAYYEQKS